ncbi:MAG: hypothetical protein AAFQ98_06845 [Bacteroidota bacterium]
MEKGEDFFIEYKGGSGWTTIGNYARGTDFNNHTRYQASLSVSAGLTSSAVFRIHCDASGNRDCVYVDDVVITGNGGSSHTFSLEAGQHVRELNLNGMHPGLYLVRVQGADIQEVQRLMVK